MHIQCLLDALMLSMKRWARFPRSWTGYASPLYSYTLLAHCLSASHSIQSIQRPYSPYSIQPYRLYTIQHYTLPLWPQMAAASEWRAQRGAHRWWKACMGSNLLHQPRSTKGPGSLKNITVDRLRPWAH